MTRSRSWQRHTQTLHDAWRVWQVARLLGGSATSSCGGGWGFYNLAALVPAKGADSLPWLAVDLPKPGHPRCKHRFPVPIRPTVRVRFDLSVVMPAARTIVTVPIILSRMAIGIVTAAVVVRVIATMVVVDVFD
jgi:hypothetical protein